MIVRVAQRSGVLGVQYAIAGRWSLVQAPYMALFFFTLISTAIKIKKYITTTAIIIFLFFYTENNYLF